MPRVTGSLLGKRFFPAFKDLPDEDELDNRYFTDPYTSGVVTFKIHFYFLGEIVANVSLVRPTFQVKDRDGKPALVALYLDQPSLYNPKHYVVGSTLVIEYACKKMFLDGQMGIRVEDGNAIQAFPCDLKRFIDIGESPALESKTCKSCGKDAAQSCVRCAVKYCDKECQTADWKSGGHKTECGVIRQVKEWKNFDWEPVSN